MRDLLLATILTLFSLIACGFGLYYLYLWLKFRNREGISLKLKFLEVKLPQQNEIEISAAEQLFANLAGIYKGGLAGRLGFQPAISFEIVGEPDSIRFIVATPYDLADFVEKQVHSAYPEGEVAEIPEYNVFAQKGQVAFAQLELKGRPYFPLKTYEDLATDPLNAITSSISKLDEGEAAVVQILISPAGEGWRLRGQKFVQGTRAAETAVGDKPRPQIKVDPKIIEGVEEKCAKVGFQVAIRLVCVGKDPITARSHLNNMINSFGQFTQPVMGKLTPRKIWFKKHFMLSFLYRYLPRLRFKTVLNTEELATIIHFPNKDVATPHIRWLLSKTAAAPRELPTEGLYLGKSLFRGVERKVYLQSDDRRRHMYIIGQTGTGKSEFLKFLAQQDIKNGEGLAFIDPHGDAVLDLLVMVPKERAEDVIYFNPGDFERPMGLNILEARTEEAKHRAINSFIALLYKMYDPQHTGIMGPRLERAIRNVMLTAMAEEKNTLVEVLRLLIDPSFAREKIPLIEDPLVKQYWTKELAQTSDFHKSETLGYFVAKFDRFVTEKIMRNIIGQSKSAFDFREVMDQGKILLVNLSKGKIGEENSSFLGLLLVPRILMAAMSRVDQPEAERRDFYLYVDEFQNFATEDFAEILAEARKYRLNLTVANQYIGQIEPQVKDAVFGNVGSVVSFRIGVDDADYLQHHFEPIFEQSDLLNLSVGATYTKLLVGGQPTKPFSLATDWSTMKAVERDPKVGEAIGEMSRLKYGRDKAVVEQEIKVRAGL